MLNIKISDISPLMGCDPEFFFKSNNDIIGAEKVLPKAGLVRPEHYNSGYTHKTKLIIDGVQAELNPAPQTCRAYLGNEIKACFQLLNAEMKKSNANITCDFSRTVEISKEKLAELEESSRKFGCAPSNSAYTAAKAGIKIEDIDCNEYRTRAAGGHIHIGHSNGTWYKGLLRALTTDHIRTVQMLDLLVGNTSVLIDRDAGNIERRKVYGRAGEFRLPAHGLEYRTLSNYWLTSYPLMSFVFAMVRFTMCLMADEKHYNTFYDAFTGAVKSQDVIDAINNNDFDLAATNFKAIEELILEITPSSSRFAIHKGISKEFKHFVNTITDKSLDYWFPEEPMHHWLTIGECHNGGFHDYLSGPVRLDMARAAKFAEKEAAKKKAA